MMSTSAAPSFSTLKADVHSRRKWQPFYALFTASKKMIVYLVEFKKWAMVLEIVIYIDIYSFAFEIKIF